MFGKKVAEKFHDLRAPKKVVMDLDAIIQETSYVRFQGKTHAVNPVEVGTFLQMANGWANIEMLKKQENLSMDDMIDGYWRVIYPVCPSITKEHLRAATVSQISALLGLIHEQTTGRVSDEKKKMMVRLPSPTIEQ